MNWFTALLIAAAVAAVAVALWRRFRRVAPSRPPGDPLAGPETAHLDGLGVGAVVGYQGQDYVVRGVLNFDESGYVWSEHLLEDSPQRRWLSVERGEGLELGWWHAVPLGEIEQGAAGDRTVVVSATAYRLAERGRARFTATGTTGTAPSGTAEYVDYTGESGRLLSFERYGEGGWEVAVGERLTPGELTVYAAPSS